MAFDYSWVADMKREADMRRLMNRGLPNYNQRPISERMGVSFTGLGSDGVLQKDHITGFENGAAIHEGETRVNTPEGSAYITADMTNLSGMKGFQSGGFNANVPGGIVSVDRKYEGTYKSDPSQNKTPKTPAIATARTVGLPTTSQKTSSVLPSQSIQTSAPVADPLNVQNQSIQQYQPQTIQTAEPTRLSGMQSIGQQIQPVGTQSIQTVAPTRQVVTAPEIYAKNINTTSEASGVQQPQVIQSDTPTVEDQARLTGMKYLSDTLTGKTASQMEGEKNVDELRLRQAQERSAAGQEGAQAGADTRTSLLSGMKLRNAQETEANALAAQYGTASAAERINTANTLASQGLSGQQFEEQKKEYGDSENWKKFESALEIGDSAAAASAYKAVTGEDLSQEALSAYTGYVQDKRAQEISQGNYTLEGLKTEVGNEKFNAITDRINSGATLDQINSELGTSVTKDQYNSMLNASALGETNWNKKLTAANMLLATEGATNKTSAAKAYSELFPGTTFDFSSVITEENNKSFSDGMSEMSDYITADMSTDDAMLALEKSGALTKMGLSKEQATQVYNGMKVNSIDAQWEEMESSDFYKNLNDEDKASMAEFFRQSMTGELDYTTMHEYEIKDSSGKVVTTVYGKDSTEADKYAKANGYSVNDTGNIKFQMASTLNVNPESEDKTTTDKYNEFLNDVPSGVTVTYDQWKKASETNGSDATKYSDYESAMKSAPVLDLKNVTDTGSDLTKAENRDKIFTAWESDPSGFKDTDFYSVAPELKDIKGIHTKATGILGTGSTKTSVPENVKTKLDNSIGKIIELPMKSGTVTGQVVSWETTPSTVQVKLMNKDGSTQNVVIYSVDEGSQNMMSSATFYGGK